MQDLVIYLAQTFPWYLRTAVGLWLPLMTACYCLWTQRGRLNSPVGMVGVLASIAIGRIMWETVKLQVVQVGAIDSAAVLAGLQNDPSFNRHVVSTMGERKRASLPEARFLTAIACSKPAAWVDELGLDDLLCLAMAVIDINKERYADPKAVGPMAAFIQKLLHVGP